MAIIRNDYPILEYSTSNTAVINPGKAEVSFPRLCIMTFFEEVFDDFVRKYNGIEIGAYKSEMKKFPIYAVRYEDKELCIVQSVVGSGSVAMMTDFLYGKGVEIIISCGSCGVLEDIPAGCVIIPTRALRDEGASYKYIEPSRYIELQADPINRFKRILDRHKVHYIECMTWSTDGFYRETADMVHYRREEGCKVVEMECATMAAIAKFRNKVFGQLLYSGDILADENNYDLRDCFGNYTAREKLFHYALEALCEC